MHLGSRTLMLLLAIGLAACETRQARRAGALGLSVRPVETASDRLYIECVARDPFFKTEQCRRARLAQSAGSDR